MFTSNGNLLFASEQLSERAKKAYYALKSSIPGNNNLSVQILLKLYQSMIIPIITYGSEIWITEYKLDIKSSYCFPFEKAQNHIFKDILGVHRKASNLAVNAELGAYPLYYLCYENMFKYFTRLSDMESNTTYNNSLLVSAFKEDKLLASKKTYSSWQSKIFNLQQKLNLTSLNISHKDFRFKLDKNFVDMIYEQLNKISCSRSGKLYFYSNILNRVDYKLQDYLKFPLKKHERSQLTKLRISAHSLFIETGRYCKPIIPKEKRFCYNCKLLVENEKHFVLYCPVYDNLRFQYCDIFNDELYCGTDPIKNIVNPCDFNSAKHLCHYLYRCFEQRKIHGM